MRTPMTFARHWGCITMPTNMPSEFSYLLAQKRKVITYRMFRSEHWCSICKQKINTTVAKIKEERKGSAAFRITATITQRP